MIRVAQGASPGSGYTGGSIGEGILNGGDGAQPGATAGGVLPADRRSPGMVRLSPLPH
jgi:hypothetical protein